VYDEQCDVEKTFRHLLGDRRVPGTTEADDVFDAATDAEKDATVKEDVAEAFYIDVVDGSAIVAVTDDRVCDDWEVDCCKKPVTGSTVL